MTPGSASSEVMMSSLMPALACESSLRAKAIIVMATIWLVYALVEATPISKPALMLMPQSVSRAIAEPTVLVMPMQRAPWFLAYLRACGQRDKDCDKRQGL